jgi:hypothetical protein
LITAQVGAETLKFTIDTGAEMNVIEDRYRKKLAGYVQGREEGTFASFGEQPEHFVAAYMPAMQIGMFTVDKMKTAFLDLSHFNRHTDGSEVDGILGHEFLSQFRVALNFKKRELYLWEVDGD